MKLYRCVVGPKMKVEFEDRCGPSLAQYLKKKRKKKKRGIIVRLACRG